MALLSRLSARLQNHPKRIVYPDGEDVRILQAARQFATRKLGVPILIGDRQKIEKNALDNDVRMDGIKVIEPLKSDDFPELLKILRSLPRFKSFEDFEIKEMAATPSYFATLMLMTGRADAMLSGATVASSSSLRQIFQLVPLQKNFKTASSIMVVSTGNEDLGINGDLFLADCGVIPEPTEEQLAEIAVTTAMLVRHLTARTPRVAMLAYTTKTPTAKVQSIMKMKAATALAHQRAQAENLDMEIDGELQADTAVSPVVAELKGIKSSVAGKAGVLIFPDLNSGNIASKLLQVMSPSSCYGQILTGLTKPVAEISRGACVEDIFGTSVIVSAQAVDRKYMSLDEA